MAPLLLETCSDGVSTQGSKCAAPGSLGAQEGDRQGAESNASKSGRSKEHKGDRWSATKRCANGAAEKRSSVTQIRGAPKSGHIDGPDARSPAEIGRNAE